MGLGLMLITALFIVGCSGNDGITGGATTNNIDLDIVKIPLDSITNEMQKFTYDSNGVEISYFVVKDSNNNVKTAFDACDVCGGSKGYRQEGNNVVCNKCGLKFAISELGTKNKGSGCWPSHLNHEIEDENIIIRTSDLEAGAFRFA